jgi:hypothetical protein
MLRGQTILLNVGVRADGGARRQASGRTCENENSTIPIYRNPAGCEEAETLKTPIIDLRKEALRVTSTLTSMADPGAVVRRAGAGQEHAVRCVLQYK